MKIILNVKFSVYSNSKSIKKTGQVEVELPLKRNGTADKVVQKATTLKYGEGAKLIKYTIDEKSVDHAECERYFAMRLAQRTAGQVA